MANLIINQNVLPIKDVLKSYSKISTNVKGANKRRISELFNINSSKSNNIKSEFKKKQLPFPKQIENTPQISQNKYSQSRLIQTPQTNLHQRFLSPEYICERAKSRQESYKTPFIASTSKVPKEFQNQNNYMRKNKFEPVNESQPEKTFIKKGFDRQNFQNFYKLFAQQDTIKIKNKQNSNVSTDNQQGQNDSNQSFSSIENNKVKNQQSKLKALIKQQNKVKFSVIDYHNISNFVPNQKKLSPIKSHQQSNEHDQKDKLEQQKNEEKMDKQQELLLKQNKHNIEKFLKYKELIEQLSLNEFITINVMKDYQANGVIKKVLHVPKLKLYLLEEIPLSSTQINNLKEKLRFWQKNLCKSNQFIDIVKTYWNSPEGHVSILQSYSNHQTLEDMILNYGIIPENLIQNIGMELSKAVNFLHNNVTQFVEDAIELNPSSILIDKQGKVKISFPHFSPKQLNNYENNLLWNSKSSMQLTIKQQIHDYYQIIKEQRQPARKKINFFDNAQQLEANKIASQQQNILNFGMVLLQCAIGDFEIFDKDYLYTKNSQQQKKKFCAFISPRNFNASSSEKSCCLMHAMFEFADKQKISQIINKQYLLSLMNYVTKEKCFIIKSMITKRYSLAFQDLLCKCLSFDESQRLSIKEIIDHPYFKENQLNAELDFQLCNTPTNNTFLKTNPKIQTNELLKLSQKVLDEKLSLDTTDLFSYQTQNSKNLENESLEREFSAICNKMNIILPCCVSYFKKEIEQNRIPQDFSNLSLNSTVIQELALQFKMQENNIINKFKQIAYSCLEQQKELFEEQNKNPKKIKFKIIRIQNNSRSTANNL